MQRSEVENIVRQVTYSKVEKYELNDLERKISHLENEIKRVINNYQSLEEEIRQLKENNSNLELKIQDIENKPYHECSCSRPNL